LREGVLDEVFWIEQRAVNVLQMNDADAGILVVVDLHPEVFDLLLDLYAGILIDD